MDLGLQIGLICFVFLFLCIIIALIRSNKIIVRYAFVWFFVGFLMLIAAVFPQILVWISKLLGFQSMMNMIFVFGILLLLVVCVSLTVIVSSQSKKIRLLIQELSIEKGERQERK